jgi:peptidyl-prolyl isomerase E (cyclophilin E)
MFSKRIVYVGGLDPAVTEEVLYAAFIPFGQLREVSIPRDFSESKEEGWSGILLFVYSSF